MEHDIPNGWGSSPSCTLIDDHIGPHRFVSIFGFTIEWVSEMWLPPSRDA